MQTFEGKVAVVTGASRGIGRGVAVGLALAGCDVAINFRERLDEANQTRRFVEATGRKALVVQADVSRPDDVARMAEAITTTLGTVEIVINNAGVARPIPLDALSLDDFDHAMNMNLRSAFLVTQAFLPGMRSRGWGRLIFLSSVAAQVGGVVGPHYAASKAGMHGMAHAYASLLAKEGITSNVVAPALIETEMVTSNPNATPKLIPVGRFGTVEETVDVVMTVAKNGYITGQTINVNGGWYFS